VPVSRRRRLSKLPPSRKPARWDQQWAAAVAGTKAGDAVLAMTKLRAKDLSHWTGLESVQLVERGVVLEAEARGQHGTWTRTATAKLRQ